MNVYQNAKIQKDGSIIVDCVHCGVKQVNPIEHECELSNITLVINFNCNQCRPIPELFIINLYALDMVGKFEDYQDKKLNQICIYKLYKATKISALQSFLSELKQSFPTFNYTICNA